MIAQALVAKLAVEAFDLAVLHRLACLDQQMSNVMPLGPGYERARGEFGPVIGVYRRGVAAEAGRLIEHACQGEQFTAVWYRRLPKGSNSQQTPSEWWSQFCVVGKSKPEG